MYIKSFYLFREIFLIITVLFTMLLCGCESEVNIKSLPEQAITIVVRNKCFLRNCLGMPLIIGDSEGDLYIVPGVMDRFKRYHGFTFKDYDIFTLVKLLRSNNKNCVVKVFEKDKKKYIASVVSCNY